MIKFMEKHRFLFRLFLMIVIVSFVYGSLYVTHLIQSARRQKTLSGQPIYATEGIKAYDVTGLSNEEIQELLDKNRNKTEE